MTRVNIAYEEGCNQACEVFNANEGELTLDEFLGEIDNPYSRFDEEREYYAFIEGFNWQIENKF
jgi:hypothetical protein